MNNIFEYTVATTGLLAQVATVGVFFLALKKPALPKVYSYVAVSTEDLSTRFLAVSITNVSAVSCYPKSCSVRFGKSVMAALLTQINFPVSIHTGDRTLATTELAPLVASFRENKGIVSACKANPSGVELEVFFGSFSACCKMPPAVVKEIIS